ncbi:protein Wnt-4-like [Orbicella faveolata]|uniref:protein Wnt-4-like n=1 Tax=Orbicella faveolata TaxID=48498 RepID=UPI0009E39DED|nr:protein Wnt-4-like [Orbicella faveolata]XP_020611839.1 protein Wnt-4-like [Orbicella faveolata]XP_020611840.1 protein Wnt-4-like [Orbicella faveolata]XP_020611841.1 protein Wnt-4-like [Orbicella faveolata]
MQNLFRAAAILLVLSVFAQRLHGIRWLAIGLPSEHNWNRSDCNKYQGFVGDQYKMCRRKLPIMKYVAEAVEMTKSECKSQLTNRRWNCSTIDKAPSFYNDLKRGTKESAYVYSLSSAAVVYSVTQACSIGRLELCGCGRTPKMKLENKNWLWGGCSDNIAYGVRFSKNFTDAVEKKRMKGQEASATSRALMNLHNNEAGRTAVRDKMAVVCRCHGVSGSCQTKTCFRRLSDFKEVATLLKKKYDKIINVVSKTKGSNKHMLRPRRGKRYTLRDLIALAASPNYCRKSESRGTLGTVGRECNPETSGKGSCAYMCCGRGYKTFTREIVERCNCQYVWCCYVKCKKCAKTITVSTCK